MVKAVSMGVLRPCEYDNNEKNARARNILFILLGAWLLKLRIFIKSDQLIECAEILNKKELLVLDFFCESNQ